MNGRRTKAAAHIALLLKGITSRRTWMGLVATLLLVPSLVASAAAVVRNCLRFMVLTLCAAVRLGTG